MKYPILASIVLFCSPILHAASGGVEFAVFVPRINRLVQGDERLEAAAERVSKEMFLNKMHTAIVIRTINGMAHSTFYTNPKETKVRFVKITFNGSSVEDIQTQIRLASAVVAAAEGANNRNLEPILALYKEALSGSDMSPSSRSFQHCEIMAIKNDGAIFFVISIK